MTLGLLALGVAAWAVVSHYRSEAERQRDAQRQQDDAVALIMAGAKQTRQSVVRMVSAHNAVTDWPDTFGGERFTDKLTSEELAPVLARKDGRPMLVFGSVVEVITRDNGCTLEVDATANLVSNIRFSLACTPAEVKETISHREKARQEALEEIYAETGEVEEETPRQKQDDDREAERRARRGYARRGYALIALVVTVHSEEAETIDDRPTKTQFTYAEGRCLELLYVGRDYSPLGGEEAYLRLNAPEDEARARQEMKLRAEMRMLAKGKDRKGNR